MVEKILDEPPVPQTGLVATDEDDPSIEALLPDGEIRMFLLSFVVMLGLMAVLYRVGAARADVLADFFSYAAPCVAGILAGAALLGRQESIAKKKESDRETRKESDKVAKKESDGPAKKSDEAAKKASEEAEKRRENAEKKQKRREKGFYLLSVTFLYVGVLAYAAAHETCRSPSFVIVVMGYLVPACSILAMRVPSKSWHWARKTGAILFYITMVVAPTALTLIYIDGFFRPGMGRVMCWDQPTSESAEAGGPAAKERGAVPVSGTMVPDASPSASVLSPTCEAALVQYTLLARATDGSASPIRSLSPWMCVH